MRIVDILLPHGIIFPTYAFQASFPENLPHLVFQNYALILKTRPGKVVFYSAPLIQIFWQTVLLSFGIFFMPNPDFERWESVICFVSVSVPIISQLIFNFTFEFFAICDILHIEIGSSSQISYHH